MTNALAALAVPVRRLVVLARMRHPHGWPAGDAAKLDDATILLRCGRDEAVSVDLVAEQDVPTTAADVPQAAFGPAARHQHRIDRQIGEVATHDEKVSGQPLSPSMAAEHNGVVTVASLGHPAHLLGASA
jgi:hypothetical protein